jgi:hypothetical protein
MKQILALLLLIRYFAARVIKFLPELLDGVNVDDLNNTDLLSQIIINI